MRRGAGEGVLRKGHIRVDARKAMAKLREHLLVDLHLYAIEVVRAAVLAGATRVDVSFDADDVVVTFDGEPLGAERLPRLFEHLTGEGGDEAGRHLRLLALAVNAALGLAPAWVALTTTAGGRASRVAWTPGLVAAIEREEAALPEVESVAAPSDMPGSGTRFHLHRKVGWEVVRRATDKSTPREIALLVEASHALRVPLFVNGARAVGSSRLPALARASMALPGARSAHVEIVGGWSTAPHVEYCELGIQLACAGFVFGRHFPMGEHARVVPPVRVVIDADALPTNASRSAVRDDAPFHGRIGNAAGPALADALAGMVAVVFGRGEVPAEVTVDTSDREALIDALGAFVCVAEGSLIARVELPEALRSLLDLPLFCDGLGGAMSYAELPRREPLLLWDGAGPVPAALAPWGREMVWRRGRVAERVLSARKALSSDELAALVERGSARRAKLLAGEAGAVVLPDEGYLAREKVSFAEGPFAGLVGEIAISADPSTYVRNLALRVFLDGRCFEAFAVPEYAVPLPCLIALQWPGQIRASFAYEGVEPTAGFRAALAFVVRRAVLLCEAVAARAAGESVEAARAAVLRAALATAVLAPLRMASAEGFEMPGLAELPGLVGARVWPTSEGGFVSLQTLCEYAARTGAVCVAPWGTAGRAVDGRPVVVVPEGEREWLGRCLQPSIVLVPYARALASASSEVRRSARAALAAFIDAAAFTARAPVLHLEGESRAFAITVGASVTRASHSGVELLRAPLAELLGGVTIAVDDDSIVPNAAWDGVLHAADQGLVARIEQAYAERVVAAVHGDERSRAQLRHAVSGRLAVPFEWPDDPRELSPAVLRYLIDRATRGLAVDASEDERELAARIAVLPLLTWLGASGEPAPASLGDLARAFATPAKIPFLKAVPSFRPVSWWPLVIADERVAEALARWSGGRLMDATGQLPAQRNAARNEDQYVRFRERLTLDPAVVGAHGDPASPSVFLPFEAEHRLPAVAAALARADSGVGSAVVEVLFEERLVVEQRFPDLLMPLVARVSLLDRGSLDAFEGLSPRGVGEVRARVRHAAIDLALALLTRAHEAGAAHTLFADARALHVVLGALSLPQPDPRIERLLRAGGLLWPTVQGGERPYHQLHAVDGTLWAGTVTFASWIAAPSASSDLDRPILHVPPTPEGAALVGILDRLGVKLRPVSDAIATLQAARARGGGDKPRLATRPVHPLLARELAALGVLGMEGEVGLFEAGESVAELTSLDGESRRRALDVSFPVRAVARVEVLTPSAAAAAGEKLARAAVRLLLHAASHLDELPLFVRRNLRALVCRAVSKQREVPALARVAAVFPDIDGAWHTLADLQAEGHPEWSCTTDPPPYPRARQEGRTLVLSAAEHLQLHGTLPILNVTSWMRRDLEADRRRDAAPVQQLTLAGDLRSELISRFTVNEGSLKGEIGVLQPWAASRRGLHAHTTRRLVCTVDDGPGWPIVAVLDDDSFHPGRWFDQLLPSEESVLRALARRLTTTHLRESLRASLPPAERMLAPTFLDEDVPPVAAYGSTEPMSVVGHVHLPAAWPDAPHVRLFVQGLAAPEERPLALASAAIDPALPLAGVLFVAHAAPAFTAGSLSRLTLALRGFAERALARLLAAQPDDPVLRTYLWNLRLLGCTALGEPTVLAADGRAITADAVIGALRDHRELWLSDRRGSIDGAFPGEPPPFVLVDDDSPLLRVLRARVPRARLRTLGALAPASLPAAALAPPSQRRPSVPAPAPASSIAPSPSFTSAADRPSTSSSWLTALVSRVGVLFGGLPPRVDPPSGIGAAVERALRAMRLTDERVIDVREVTQGKLVRYHPRTRELAINVAHPSLARHAAAASPVVLRRVCLALVAAALSEINIALEHVTGHDEAQALLELLRQEAATAITPRPDA